MHKYVTRQRVLFEHRVQELSGAETSLKNAKADAATARGAQPQPGCGARTAGWFVPFVCSEQFEKKNRKASHDRAHSERRAA